MASNIDHYLVLLLLFTFTAIATAPRSSLSPLNRWTNMLSELSGLRELATVICRAAIFRYMTSSQWPHELFVWLNLAQVLFAFRMESLHSLEYDLAFLALATLRRHPQGRPPISVYVYARVSVPFDGHDVNNHVVSQANLHLSRISHVQVFFART
ncbi:hypothetical protein AXF42_Ash012072 [Apostasia shenzhenica]|uniref:Uncharacterized protein n=1 Tax=Apostasia shenzhenica TaxID=1088818 RepID=A0A2I0AJR3_9ASPA|nr:hypothetical protein AXF42_Ash012072 [Apostasia shenzhenica]